MDKLPLISVIVPVYRVEQYLDICVHSILSQTYQNLEVILVDDGSPDNSGCLCDRWAERDSRVHVIHQKNGGGGAARNAALDMARGELIAFVDSDDYIAPDMFRYLYSLLEQGADVAECAYLETDTDTAEFPEAEENLRWFSGEEAMAEHIRDTVFRQLIWNKLYRREVIGDIRFPVGTKIDDEFFTYQVLGNAKRLVRSEKTCYAYRQQPCSIMHQKNPVKTMEGLQAKELRLEYLRKVMPQLDQIAKTELLLSCVYALQACCRDLTGEARDTAVDAICAMIRRLQPVDLTVAESGKQRLLLKAAEKWPVTVARVLNLLTDLHILT